MIKYSELLKDPRWQKNRLKILERDKFTCKVCEQTDKTLHVHHLRYEKGKKPWEYTEWDLITLCEECHGVLHTLKKLDISIFHIGAILLTFLDFEIDRSIKENV